MSGRGLSKSRLERLHRVLGGHVERGELPGLVALVARDGEAHVAALGTLAVDGAAPMRRDTIFRIASLTKPITAAAAMILVEDGRLRLDESVEPWLPELANRRVLRSIASEPDDTVPARRAITLRDLLTSTMGFGSVMAMPGIHPIQALIREHRIGGDGPPRPALLPGTDEWLRALGSLPWMAQPGERFAYHVSIDVLGVLVARAAGVSLGSFLRDRLFEPLGMRETAFHVPDAKLARLPVSYRFDAAASSLVVFDDVEHSAWRGQPPFESGGGGLVSTADDYLAFQRMMLAGGRHGREQILSRAAVALMTADQLTPAQRAGNEVFFGAHSSWGFGMAVAVRRDTTFRTPGRFGWDGGLGTSAYADPVEGMIGVLLTQRMLESPVAPPLVEDFWTLAYGAME